MDIVNRIYFDNSGKTDFNIKPPDNNIIESQYNFSRLNYTYIYNMIYINKIGYYDEDNNIYMICNFRFIVLFI